MMLEEFNELINIELGYLDLTNQSIFELSSIMEMNNLMNFNWQPCQNC